jgi:hypothetical protein
MNLVEIENKVLRYAPLHPAARSEKTNIPLLYLNPVLLLAIHLRLLPGEQLPVPARISPVTGAPLLLWPSHQRQLLGPLLTAPPLPLLPKVFRLLETELVQALARAPALLLELI